MSKLRSCLLAVACAVASLSFSVRAAETLPVPKEWVHGFINGYFSLVAYSFNGDVAMPVEIQMKDKDALDEEYKTISLSYGTNGQYTYDGHRSPFVGDLQTGVTSTADDHRLNEHVIATNFLGTATFRMRANNGTDVSPWVDLGDSTAYVRLPGTKISSSNVNAENIAKLDDGKLEGLIDMKDCWAGYDLGKTMKVRGVRYYSRGDGSFGRIDGVRVECADNAAFVDAVTVVTISKNDPTTADKRKITFLEFHEPMETRYVRMCSGAEQISLAEVEIVAAENPYVPEVESATEVNGAHAYVKLSWSVPAVAFPVSSRVVRSAALAGPYSPVTEWTAGGDGTFTDVEAKVSVGYYYKVETLCAHPSFQGEDEKVIVSDAKHGYHARRLDRDPSTGELASGVSYMACTNGTVNSTAMAKAFDGSVDTWPDTIDFYYGPVGLKFPVKVWVSTFGYVCRHNQRNRMKMVALFSADEDDVTLDGKVQRSQRPTQVDENKTLFFMDADSLPADGARQYFLWKCDTVNETFHGNVAELQFFGWTQDDVDAAGVLAPPTEISFEPLADGLRVSWNAGTAAAGYALQRRVHGTEEWTTVYDGDDKTVRSHDDVGIASANYDYRVVAKREEETAASSVFSTIYYVHGSGTGLRSTVFWPFKATDPSLCAPDRSHERGVEAPALEFAAEDEFAPGVTENAYVAMKGKLTVPFAGAYTFRLDVANGGAVYVDGAWAVNGWVGGSLSDSIQLTAGEHEIEIHARLEDAANRLKLYWSGPVNEELVPASQLTPSDASYTFDRGNGWNARFYGGDKRGEVVGDSSNDVVSIIASRVPAANWRTDPHVVFMARKCRTSFTLSATLDDSETAGSGNFGLMARAPNGNFVMFYGLNGGTDNADSFVDVLKEGAGGAVERVATGDEFYSFVYDMKMEYDKPSGTFTCYMKRHVDADYSLVGSWTNDGSIPDEFEVGYFVGGGSGGATRSRAKVNFLNRVFKKRFGTAVMVR